MLKLQLTFNFFLFTLGLLGVWINRRHFLMVLICIELILLSLNFSFLLLALQFDDSFGFLYSFFMLTIAAAESSIGLALIILYYKSAGNIEFINKFSLKS
jgi:NADH-quinone oxidoreductase subunit K